MRLASVSRIVTAATFSLLLAAGCTPAPPGDGSNNPPLADAGNNQVVVVNNVAVLSGAGSVDPDGDQIFYAWQQVGASTVTLANPAGVTTSFVATAPGDLDFRLTVTDARGGSDTDTVRVTVVPEGEEGAPLADAGEDREVNPGAVVSLDGSASVDPDGGPLSFAWSQLSGTDVDLTDATSSVASFTAPDVSETEVLVFQLLVTDEEDLDASDSVSITVLAGGSGPSCEEDGICAGDCDPPDPDCACSTDDDCNDGLFCNGEETCDNGFCQAGVPPCEDLQECDEGSNACVAPACDVDADCDDGLFCNGEEVCLDGTCGDGESPCADDQRCEEEDDTCVDLTFVDLQTLTFRGDVPAGIDPATYSIGGGTVTFSGGTGQMLDVSREGLHDLLDEWAFVAAGTGGTSTVMFTGLDVRGLRFYFADLGSPGATVVALDADGTTAGTAASQTTAFPGDSRAFVDFESLAQPIVQLVISPPSGVTVSVDSMTITVAQ